MHGLWAQISTLILYYHSEKQSKLNRKIITKIAINFSILDVAFFIAEHNKDSLLARVDKLKSFLNRYEF